MIRKMVWATVALAMLIGAAVVALLYSEWGLQTTLSLVSKVTEGKVVVQHAAGRLAGETSCQGVTVLTDRFDLYIEHLKIRWKPGKLLSGTLHIAEISARDFRYGIKSTGAEKDTQTEPFTRLKLTLPLALVLDMVEINGGKIYRDVSILAASAQPLHVFNHLQATASGASEKAIIESFSIEAPDYGLLVTAGLKMTDNWPLELAGTWWLKPDQFDRLDGVIKGSGNLENPTLDVEIGKPFSARLTGSISDLFTDFSWHLQATAAGVAATMIDARLPDCRATLELASTGAPSAYTATGSTRVQCNETTTIDVLTEIAGDTNGVTNKTSIQSETIGSLSAAGSVGWQDGLAWNLDLSIAQNNRTDLFVVPWHKLSMTVGSTGTYKNQSLVHQTTIAGLSARLTASGAELAGDVFLEGSESELVVTIEDFQVAGGTMTGSGRLDFSTGVNWLINLAVADFNPAQWGAYPEGTIATRFESTGIYRDGLDEWRLKIVDIDGTLADRAVSGGGTIEHRAGRSQIDKIFLENGRNRIDLEGQIDQQLDLRFVLNVDEFAQFMPQLAGRLSAQGKIGGTLGLPRFDVTIDGGGLSLGDIRLASLQGAFQLDLAPQGITAGQLSLAQLKVANSSVASVTIELAGTATDHQLEAVAVADDWQLGLILAGGYYQDSGWRGTLSKTVFSGANYGLWQQQEPTVLAAGPAGLELDTLCLGEKSDRICLDGYLRKERRWLVNLREARFDLLRLYDAGLLQQKLSGTFLARFSAEGVGAELTAADLKLEIPEMHVAGKIQDYFPVFSWYDLILQGSVDDGTLHTEVSGWFIDGSTIEGHFGIAGFDRLDGELATRPLEGSLLVDIKDLKPLSILTENYLVPSGTLRADLQVSGQLQSPELSGEMMLEDGVINFPQLGITAGEITTDIDFKKQRIDIALEAQSGEGKAVAVGSLEIGSPGWGGTFAITADAFELFNQKELELIADAALDLVLSEKGGTLSGTLFIPRALIEPDEMTGTVSESADVIIIDNLDQSGSWPFELDLSIGFGDQVQLDGYGLSGNLMGDLEVANHPNKGMVGTGRLDLKDGKFAIFGRTLDISRGRIVFNDGPISNPGLDVSARKIIGARGFNRSTTTVGVNIVGSVLDHEVTLFSIPQMSDSEIVAYLLLDQASVATGESSGLLGTAANAVGASAGNEVLGDIGQLLPVDDFVLGGDIYSDPSLVVGKRLSKEIYLSYDFSLLDNRGYFKIRYDFGRGFFLETKSSSESNGVDLFYSFER